MRKIIVSNYVSLDGFFAGPNGEYDWFVWNEETEAYAVNLLHTVDTLMFGRVTYEMMADYWPKATSPPESQEIIAAMNNLPKIVFSGTLEKTGWNNTRLINSITPEQIREIKNQPGKDIVIFGSGRIVSALTDLGLVDEYHILLNPVILGDGKTMFQQITNRTARLKLMVSKPLSSGVVILIYRQA